jgi:branched-chain amino acid transport system substrate-binding protein
VSTNVNHRRMRLGALVLTCTTAALIAGCGSQQSASSASSASSDPAEGIFANHVVIGFAARLTGPLASQPLVDGLTAAVNDVNKSGGIYGRKIDLVTVDTQSTAPGEVSAYEQLTRVDHALAVVGSGYSSGSAAVLPLLASAKVPYLVGGASLYGTDGVPFQQYYYTNMSTYADQVSIAMAYEQQQLKAAGIAKPRVAVVVISSSAGTEWTDLTEKWVQAAGWTWLGGQDISPDAVNATAIGETVAAQKPNLVSVMGDPNTMLLFNKALAPTGLRPFEVNGFGDMVESAIPELPQGLVPKMAWVNTYAPPYADSPFPGALSARKAAIENGYSSALSQYGFGPDYVTGQIIIAALKAAGPDLTRARFIAALNGLTNLSTGDLTPSVQLSATNHEAVHGALPYTWDAAKSEFVPQGSFASWSVALSQSPLG